MRYLQNVAEKALLRLRVLGGRNLDNSAIHFTRYANYRTGVGSK